MNYRLLRTRTFTASVLALLFFGIYFLMPPIALSSVALIVLCQILLYEWSAIIRNVPFLYLITPIYPIASFIPFLLLNHHSVYRPLLIMAIGCAALFDTTAYLIGSYYGRYRIAPSISPSKSLEGLLGGCVAVGLLVSGIVYYIHESYTIDVIWYTIGISLCCVSGDLFESWLKRAAKLKDSGKLLPGHGGLLDRCDSLLFLIWFFYIFRQPLACMCALF